MFYKHPKWYRALRYCKLKKGKGRKKALFYKTKKNEERRICYVKYI